MMLAPETALPPVGYSIAECERIAGAAPKTLYRKVRSGELQAFVDSNGQLKVHQYQLWRFLSERTK